jgi:signal transduction histidine kinase
MPDGSERMPVVIRSGTGRCREFRPDCHPDLKGNVLLNPALPEREGTNVAGGKDAKGKPFQDDILKVATAQGSGWVSYMFPKPGQT